jgi:hypothetical protein
MGFLEVAGADLRRRDVGCKGQYGGAAAVCVVQALDKVGVAGAAASSAYGKSAGHLGFGCCGECGGFFVADVHSVDVIVSADGIGDRVEAVSDETVDSLDAGGREGVDELFGDGGCHEVAVRGCGVSAGVLDQWGTRPLSGVEARQVTCGGRFSGTHKLKAEKDGQRYAKWVCPLREMAIKEVWTPEDRSAFQDDLVG